MNGRRAFPLLAVMVGGALLAGCLPRPIPDPGSDDFIDSGRCMALADALQTLRPGDPLPRVREVLGPPDRSYRTLTTFGRGFDVIEYDTGLGPCARYLLNAPRRLSILFDEKGQLVGYGHKKFNMLRGGATSVRVVGGTGGY